MRTFKPLGVTIVACTVVGLALILLGFFANPFAGDGDHRAAASPVSPINQSAPTLPEPLQHSLEEAGFALPSDGTTVRKHQECQLESRDEDGNCRNVYYQRWERRDATVTLYANTAYQATYGISTISFKTPTTARYNETRCGVEESDRSNLTYALNNSASIRDDIAASLNEGLPFIPLVRSEARPDSLVAWTSTGYCYVNNTHAKWPHEVAVTAAR